MQYTQNLELPIFESGDAVDLIAVYNAAMAILDSTIAGNETDIATALSTANAADTKATNAASAAATAQSAASTANSKADTLSTSLTKTNTSMTVGDLSTLKVTTGGYIAKPDSNS